MTRVGASSWLPPLFVNGNLFFSDQEFILLVSRCLGVKFYDDSNGRARCVNAGRVNYRHEVCKCRMDARFIHVTELCKPTFTCRHNNVARTLAQLARYAGFITLLEISLPGSSVVPGDVYLPEGPNGRPVALDITVTSVHTQYAIKTFDTNNEPEHSTNLKQKEKHRKYDNLFEVKDKDKEIEKDKDKDITETKVDKMKSNADFIAFVMTSYGGRNVEAQNFCNMLAGRIADNWVVTFAEALSYVNSWVVASMLKSIAGFLLRANERCFKLMIKVFRDEKNY